MQNIDVQDVVKTAYENAGKFLHSYNMYWDTNNVAANGRLETINVTAMLYKEFLLGDDTISYEYKKTALQMATEHFCSLQERLVVNALNEFSANEERRKGLHKYIKDVDKMRTTIVSKASEIVSKMLEMEKNITNDLEEEVLAQQKTKTIRKVK